MLKEFEQLLQDREVQRYSEKPSSGTNKPQTRHKCLPLVEGSVVLKRRVSVLGAPVWRLIENLRPLKDMMAMRERDKEKRVDERLE